MVREDSAVCYICSGGGGDGAAIDATSCLLSLRDRLDLLLMRRIGSLVVRFDLLLLRLRCERRLILSIGLLCAERPLLFKPLYNNAF